jgi:hypothetical protein
VESRERKQVVRQLFTGKLLSLAFALVIGGAGIYVLQDSIEERVAGLEARVAALESDVTSLRGGADTASVRYTVEGTIQLRQEFDRDVLWLDGFCGGTGGYDDISTGSNIVVLDGSGNTLATTTLETREGFDPTEGSSNVCEFVFTVQVPEATFYTIEIGHRGGPTYSLAEMEDNDWQVDLAIG